jgi:cobalt/nickel transport protein
MHSRITAVLGAILTMRCVFFYLSLFGSLLTGEGVAFGHYNMLIPQTPSTKRGLPVSIVYQWGHPFEHQLFDAPLPSMFAIFDPSGRRLVMGAKLERAKESNSGGKDVTVYRTLFTPDKRGDYVLTLATPPIWMEEDREFLQDSVRTVLHVQVQKGWDQTLGKGLEVVPLTRPYGLEPAMSFQGQVMFDGRPLPGKLVEIEHYNQTPPTPVPPDEHVTRTVKTDFAGSFVATLTEPGWWGLTSSRDAGQRLHGTKEFPLRQRATFWVHVDDVQTPRK